MSDKSGTAIRFLVESALKTVASKRSQNKARTREEWVELLCDALMSESETSYQAVLTSLVASGVSTEQIHASYIPAAARRLGEMWVQDRANFVQVTVGAGRLQAIFQERNAVLPARWIDRTIPLGQSVLMILPENEDHTLGAFVAADRFRRHGLWVRMAIRLSAEELVQLIDEGHFSLIGISLCTEKAVESVADMIQCLRSELKSCPPIAIGGRLPAVAEDVGERTGADLCVRSVREAIERVRLVTVKEPLFDDMQVKIGN